MPWTFELPIVTVFDVFVVVVVVSNVILLLSFISMTVLMLPTDKLVDGLDDVVACCCCF